MCLWLQKEVLPDWLTGDGGEREGEGEDGFFIMIAGRVIVPLRTRAGEGNSVCRKYETKAWHSISHKESDVTVPSILHTRRGLAPDMTLAHT